MDVKRGRGVIHAPERKKLIDTPRIDPAILLNWPHARLFADPLIAISHLATTRFSAKSDSLVSAPMWWTPASERDLSR